MSDDRWILNDEDWEQSQYDDQRTSDTAETRTDTLAGQDSSGVVTIHVTPGGEVVDVDLAAGWENVIESHNLNGAVLAAANAATAQALAQRMEGFESESTESEAVNQVESQTTVDSTIEDSRVTAEDAMRLLEAVTTDLNNFMNQVSSISDHPVRVESSGGHVTASGRSGQIMEAEVDPRWAGSVRDSEVESEIVEVLRRVNEKSSLGELANGPQSRNIAELNALVSDPQTLMRRVGLAPVHRSDEQGD